MKCQLNTSKLAYLISLDSPLSALHCIFIKCKTVNETYNLCCHFEGKTMNSSYIVSLSKKLALRLKQQIVQILKIVIYDSDGLNTLLVYSKRFVLMQNQVSYHYRIDKNKFKIKANQIPFALRLLQCRWWNVEHYHICQGCCRYMAEILPIRRKTLSNQSYDRDRNIKQGKNM